MAGSAAYVLLRPRELSAVFLASIGHSMTAPFNRLLDQTMTSFTDRKDPISLKDGKKGVIPQPVKNNFSILHSVF